MKWITLMFKLINDWTAVAYTKNYSNLEKREPLELIEPRDSLVVF